MVIMAEGAKQKAGELASGQAKSEGYNLIWAYNLKLSITMDYFYPTQWQLKSLYKRKNRLNYPSKLIMERILWKLLFI